MKCPHCTALLPPRGKWSSIIENVARRREEEELCATRVCLQATSNTHAVELALSVGTPRTELAAAKDETDGAVADLGERQRRRNTLKVQAKGFVHA